MILPCTGISTTEAGLANLHVIVNGDWRKIEAMFNPAWGKTARQDDGTPPGDGTVVTASGSVFLPTDTGGTLIRWDDGSVAEITGYTSGTIVTVSDSKTVSSQGFTIFRDPSDLDEDLAYMAIARGLMKRVAFSSADDGMFPAWSNANERFVFTTQPGFGVTLGNLLFGGGASTAPASSADLHFNDTTDVLTVAGRIEVGKNFKTGLLALTSSASVALDFQAEQWKTLPLAHNVTFTSQNLATGREVVLRIVDSGAGQTLAFPGGWIFVGGAAPATIAAGKTGLLKLRSFGTTDANVVAEWSVQP